ncbi:NAD(P)/FAD-dependent oxidoreductase [Jejudonia soesokkakensis]|uniref:NAD(P)/FAD-dependent oxidoreductase n=1 Tax=Jejudonia soesokkakensis TaxID=1323432 RepID=A0ABW2MRY6_9FLAO
MQQVEYIVVGLGIAGISFCERLFAANKAFVVYDPGVNHSTLISGGVLNPVVLKRFTATWRAQEQLDAAIAFYKSLSETLTIPLLEATAIHRIFKSIEEQNDWMVASDKKELSSFLASEISKNTNTAINAPFGFGKVHNAFKINTSLLINAYRKYLAKEGLLQAETFEYEALKSTTEGFQYKNILAKKIVFSEGASVIHNPYFRNDFVIPNKGEYVLIYAPQLQSDAILKGGMHLIPLGNDTYKVGATYARDEFDTHPSEVKKQQIIIQLEKMISCEYEIVGHIAGVRPTTKDRRPLLGSLAAHKNIYFFSGLGTRGIMGAPWLSKKLLDFSEHTIPLPEEVAISRFC